MRIQPNFPIEGKVRKKCFSNNGPYIRKYFSSSEQKGSKDSAVENSKRTWNMKSLSRLFFIFCQIFVILNDYSKFQSIKKSLAQLVYIGALASTHFLADSEYPKIQFRAPVLPLMWICIFFWNKLSETAIDFLKLKMIGSWVDPLIYSELKIEK